MRLYLLVLNLLITFSALASPLHINREGDEADCRRRHQLSVQEILASLAPDKMVERAHHDDHLYVSQPQFAEISPAFVGHHNDKYREGIDVSHYQGKIDWQRVAKDGGVSYVYIKATEGADLTDDHYATNIREARKAGLSVGSYHFYRPRADVDAQFANMARVVKKGDQDLVPIIDIEDDRSASEEAFISNLRRFIERVTKHYGRKPLLYTGQNFYNKHFQGLFTDYQWMIAKYQDEPPVLLDDHFYLFWQYTAKGSVPGIRGNVDRSCLMGNGSLKLVLM